MSINSFRALVAIALVVPGMVHAQGGAIFDRGAGYTPLTSGARATAIGDVLTVALVERTSATKSAGQTTGRNGSVGLSPPASGPLALFSATDLNMGGNQSFKGAGQAEQSNALSGEISVRIAEILPGGMMRISGEKRLTLNRGDEFIRISGLIRAADIGPDNRVASNRIADAVISYTGKGEVARASRQGWLQRFFSAVSPF